MVMKHSWSTFGFNSLVSTRAMDLLVEEVPLFFVRHSSGVKFPFSMCKLSWNFGELRCFDVFTGPLFIFYCGKTPLSRHLGNCIWPLFEWMAFLRKIQNGLVLNVIIVEGFLGLMEMMGLQCNSDVTGVVNDVFDCKAVMEVAQGS